MKLPISLSSLLWIILLSTILVSCTSAPNMPVQLASFTENDVTVSIQLNSDTEGKSVLSAMFTPPEGYHLYSKDIPYNGLDGLGRPTLLELLSESQMRVVGELTESAKAQVPDFEPRELLVYPMGAVTLSLKIELPPGRDWFNDSVSVTYMACSNLLCRQPVEGKIVPIRIPGSEVFDQQ